MTDQAGTRETSLSVIARIHSGFPEKFGIPRQSGLIDALKAHIVFEPEYRNFDAVRGLEAFSHIWLIWKFSALKRATWSPTVRPPRLGGNVRMGVFATRSPYRPNPLGLSCVRLCSIEHHQEWGPVLHVAGADLMDGTPVFDIKPYLPSADSHSEALAGFVDTVPARKLDIRLKEELEGGANALLPMEKKELLYELLALDPRPAYHRASGRVYRMRYDGLEVRFSVQGSILSVLDIRPDDEKSIAGYTAAAPKNGL